MKYPYWIFDMDGTLTDSMPIWSQVPYELVRGFGRTPAPDLDRILLPMSAFETAQYLISTYDLPLTIDSYTRAAVDAVGRLYQNVTLKPGVEQVLRRLEAEGAKMCVCSATWQFMCERVLGRLGRLQLPAGQLEEAARRRDEITGALAPWFDGVLLDLVPRKEE